MKVKDFLRKVNYGSAKLPVYLQNGITGKKRKAVSFDFADYEYEEKDKTVSSFSIGADSITVFYK